MIHAYDKSYLSAAQKNLARMLDYLVNDLHYPLETAWQWFVTSELSARFEQGDCSVLVGLSGVELARAVLEQAGEVVPMQKTSYAYDRSPEYWTGWALAYYQWLTGLRFAEIEQAVSITKVRLLYTPYHEMDVRQFADKMNELSSGISIHCYLNRPSHLWTNAYHIFSSYMAFFNIVRYSS